MDRERIRQGDTIRHADDDYSTEKRERVANAILDLWGNGGGVRDIAHESNVSDATARSTLNDYFAPVEAGANASEQELIQIDEDAADAEETDAGVVEQMPDEANGNGEAEATQMGESVDYQRVALLSDWYDVSSEQAEVLVKAEESAGIEFTGREIIEGQPEERDEEDVVLEHEMPDEREAPTDEQRLAEYRLGVKDGFMLAKQLEEE